MQILDFALEVGKLKKIKRTGWIRENIPNPESVAEHSFRVAVLVMILAPKVGADTNKAVQMALVHDVGEAKIGDIVTSRGGKIQKNLEEKLIAERNALTDILSLIDGNEYIALFDEFEENKTKEAQLVKQVDRLEVAIQAVEYEQEHTINLQEFFDYADSNIVDDTIKEILTAILTLRQK